LIGPVRTLDEISKLVDAVTHESINTYLAANPPRDFVVATLGPRPLELPDGVS
jgi:hypothetical protein